MRKITVAHVAGGLTTGGVENMVFQYITHMPEENYNWIYITYDTPNEMVREQFEAQGVKVYEVAKKKEHFFKSCRQVYRILKENRVDIVHSHMTLMCFITNIIGGLAGAGKRISHAHLVLYPSKIKRPVYRIFKKLTSWTATDRFACSRDAAEYLYGKAALRKGRVRILNNALDGRLFEFQPEIRQDIRRKYGLESKTVLGHVGRFTEQKNHSFLLDVFADYNKERNENSSLLLVGDGPLFEKMKEKAKKLGIEENVIFAGATDHVQELYMAMDIFLFPSLYEGLGIVALEAQLTGLPVLASLEVPREAALSEDMCFLSRDAGIKEWSRKTEALQRERRGSALEHVLAERNLDIHTEAKKLDAIYRCSN